MFCQQCGTELPANATACAACGARVYLPPTPAHPNGSTFEQVLADVKQGARELATTAAQLSRMAAEKADAAARDPKGVPRKAVDRLEKELKQLAQELDRVIQNL